MKISRYLIFFIFFLFHLAPAPAKENKDLMKANYYYTHYAFADAIPFFEKIADTLKDPAIFSKLADCYTVANNLQGALKAYAKAVKLPGCSNTIMLRYAQVLMQMTQYDEAVKWLEKYKETNKTDRRAANNIAGCAYGKNMMHAIPQGTATLLPFNTDGSDFAPVMWKGKLVFTSDTATDVKKKKDTWTGRSYYNLFSVSCDDKGNCGNEFDKIAETKSLNIKYHDGPATFTADGKQMYFTRSRYNESFMAKKSVSNKDSIVLLEIMIATEFDNENKKFKTITPFQYNSDEYSVAHPSISPNGKVLVFSSNMPKGQGGSDLYLCKKTGSMWSKPQNIGTVINTEGEEVFPYWADDATLFFSSDGHEGMGGLDIYKSKWDEKTNTFSIAENVGTPINSSYDDISLALFADGRSTYFSSNRPASKGNDNIYFFKKQKIFLQIKVIDSSTMQPLADADISLDANPDKKNIKSDNNGQYFIQLYPGEQYTVAVSKNEYGSSQLVFNATSEKEVDTIIKTFKFAKRPPRRADTIARLEPPVVKTRNIMDTPGIRVFEKDEIYIIGHFYYDYDKSSLKEIHKVFLDTLLTQLYRHPTMRIEIRAHTDCRGSVEYNKVLSTNRALSVLNYLADHGIKRNRLEYIGLGSTMPTVPCPDCQSCTEQEHYVNRVLEFRVLEL